MLATTRQWLKCLLKAKDFIKQLMTLILGKGVWTKQLLKQVAVQCAVAAVISGVTAFVISFDQVQIKSSLLTVYA